MILGYIKLVPSHPLRWWCLYDEYGVEYAYGDHVHCVNVAWRRNIFIVTIH